MPNNCNCANCRFNRSENIQVTAVNQENRSIPKLKAPEKRVKLSKRQERIFRTLSDEMKIAYTLTKVNRKALDKSTRINLQVLVQNAKQELKTCGEDELASRVYYFSTPGSWAKDQIKRLAKRIYEDKTPTKDFLGKWISIELECIMPDSESEETFVAWARKENLVKFITLKDDGSLRASTGDDVDHYCGGCDNDEGDCTCCGQECDCHSKGSAYGREIVLSCVWNDWTLIRKVCGKLNSLDVTVNNTCGLHVHFDCRHLNEDQVANIGIRVASTVPALKLILPKSRQNNQYCEAVINTMDGDDRYAFVNLQSFHRHSTLEIRGHSGTTDAKKIINWICILRRIMRTPKSRSTIRTIDTLLDKYKFRKDLVEYIKERAKKFSKSSDYDGEVSNDNRDAA